LNVKKYIKYSENFEGKLCFSWQAQVDQILNSKNIFNTVYSLGVIRVIWAGVVCNLD